MDIASRLKEYLDYSGMQSTQFADACGIPRPSFSQLLRGRNRKVSDEVIAKIHEAFPQLSVLWLMFGEGEMVQSINNEISEPQNALNSAMNISETTEIQDYNALDFENETPKDFAKSVNPPPFSELTGNMSPMESDFRSTPKQMYGDKPKFRDESHGITSISVQPIEARRVVRIMVFYNDQSFETFIPEK